jgi:hypothetical protein
MCTLPCVRGKTLHIVVTNCPSEVGHVQPSSAVPFSNQRRNCLCRGYLSVLSCLHFRRQVHLMCMQSVHIPVRSWYQRALCDMYFAASTLIHPVARMPLPAHSGYCMWTMNVVQHFTASLAACNTNWPCVRSGSEVGQGNRVLFQL